METQWLDQSSYKEDCEWAIVALTFPELFTGYERKCADRTLRDWWPSEWENIHGRKLEPDKSHLKDQQAFERNHADHWVVISALRSKHHPGMTEVIATRGGRRDHHVEEQRFLVPSAEYQPGRFGFVIDEIRHTAYDGPSSFATWAGEARVMHAISSHVLLSPWRWSIGRHGVTSACCADRSKAVSSLSLSP